MKKELTIQSVMSQAAFEWFTVGEANITFKQSTPQDVWLEVTKTVLDAYEATHDTHCRMMAKVADCLNYGERSFGENYSQAIDDTRKFLRVQHKTIANAMFTFARVPAENRHVDTLTLTHHELVATLDAKTQKKLLQQAEDEELTTASFAHLVARAKLTDDDKTAIATVTSTSPDELSAQEIKKALKRAKKIAAGTDTPPEEKVILDLNSDQGLRDAIEKAIGRLKNTDFGEMDIPEQKKWSGIIIDLVIAFRTCRREFFAKVLAEEAIAYLAYAEAERPANEWPAERKAEWKTILAPVAEIIGRLNDEGPK